MSPNCLKPSARSRFDMKLMPDLDFCCLTFSLSRSSMMAVAIASGVGSAKVTPVSGTSYRLFSRYRSTTGRPAAIISKGILDGFEELRQRPTLHLL